MKFSKKLIKQTSGEFRIVDLLAGFKYLKEVTEQKPKEMTLSEVCSELGYDIKIKKETT